MTTGRASRGSASKATDSAYCIQSRRRAAFPAISTDTPRAAGWPEPATEPARFSHFRWMRRGMWQRVRCRWPGTGAPASIPCAKPRRIHMRCGTHPMGAGLSYRIWERTRSCPIRWIQPESPTFRRAWRGHHPRGAGRACRCSAPTGSIWFLSRKSVRCWSACAGTMARSTKTAASAASSRPLPGQIPRRASAGTLRAGLSECQTAAPTASRCFILKAMADASRRGWNCHAVAKSREISPFPPAAAG